VTAYTQTITTDITVTQHKDQIYTEAINLWCWW